VPSQFACSSSALVAITGCNGATDGGSTVQSGGPVDTSKPGTHTFTVAAEDASGNLGTKSVTFTVQFSFGGFQPPVSNTTLNIANAGSTIPLKWTLTDLAGNTYANMDAIQGISSRQIACPHGGTTSLDPTDEPIGTNGGAGVTGGVFHYNWATLRAWSGTCRELDVHLSDNSTRTATFQFR
jgi:hypothetical protein